MKAFNFIDFHVDTHFSARGRLGRLPALLVDTRQGLGAGIDEKTALFYEDGIGTVYGYNGVTICDMEKALVRPQSFFTASNVRSSYLSVGDSYDFNSKKLSSVKSRIGSPAYQGPTDSNDILSSYEAVRLMTREVDQRAVYNVGKTRRPSAFSERTTPTFEIRFDKDQFTEGYYSDKLYSVSNLPLDFSFGSNSL